jgi:hypothetical protein
MIYGQDEQFIACVVYRRIVTYNPTQARISPTTINADQASDGDHPQIKADAQVFCTQLSD